MQPVVGFQMTEGEGGEAIYNFRAHVSQTERWPSYTSTIPKTCYNSSKTVGFPLQVFKNSSLAVSEKSEIGARPDRKADNPMTGSDFDWMVSNHAVWG